MIEKEEQKLYFFGQLCYNVCVRLEEKSERKLKK